MTRVSYLSFEIGIETNREVDDAEKGFFEQTLLALGIEAPDIVASGSDSTSALPSEVGKKPRLFQLVEEGLQRALDYEVVVARFNVNNLTDEWAHDAIINALEVATARFQEESGLRLLVSLPEIPDWSRIKLARPVATGALALVDDAGQSLPETLPGLDRDLWRYQMTALYGDDLARLTQGVERRRGLFELSEGRLVRYEYDLSAACGEISRLLALWILPRQFQYASGGLSVCWFESRLGWMSQSIAGLAEEMRPYGTEVVEAIQDPEGNSWRFRDDVRPTGKVVVIAPVIDSGHTVVSLVEFLTDRNYPVGEVFTVLSVDASGSELPHHGVKALPSGDSVIVARYLISVPQKYRNRSSRASARRIETYESLNSCDSFCHPLDFWDFVRSAGVIRERMTEIPSNRRPLIVPAFGRGTLLEGRWLGRMVWRLLADCWGERASDAILVIPDGDLASTILSRSLVADHPDLDVASVPRPVLTQIAGDVDLDHGQFNAFHRLDKWHDVLRRRHQRLVVLFDEFRSTGGTLASLGKLVRVVGPSDGGPDGVVVLLDLRPENSIEGIEDIECHSLYSWTTHQSEPHEDDRPRATSEDTDRIVPYLAELIRRPKVPELERILILDQLTSLVGRPEARARFAGSLLPDEGRSILGFVDRGSLQSTTSSAAGAETHVRGVHPSEDEGAGEEALGNMPL